MSSHRPKENIYETHMNCYISRAVSVIFTQMHAKKAIEVFGEKARVAIYKYFKQVHDGAV